MSKHTLASALLVATTLVLTSHASAEPAAPAPAPQHLKFDDDRVEGDIVRPEDALVSGARHTRFSSLLRVRANFVDELLRSADLL